MMQAKIIAREDIPNGSMISVIRYINAPDEAYVVWDDSIFSIGVVTSFVTKGEELIEGINYTTTYHTLSASWEELTNITYWPMIRWLMDKLTGVIQWTTSIALHLRDWGDGK